MADQPTAAKLAREAFDQWQAGQHSRSKVLYKKALSLAAPEHWALSAYHGEYACVLNELGEHEAATEQLKQALSVELSQGNPEGSPSVTMARYFLSDQFLRHGAAGRALEVLAPSVANAPTDWCTRVAEAHALFALGRRPEAKAAAGLAVLHAPTPQKAEELRSNLSALLEAPDA
jgi:tetratricopeptide (TPR) repeat protein